MGCREHHSGIIHLSLKLFSSLQRAHTSHINPHKLFEATVCQCVQPKAQELSTPQWAGADLQACKVPFLYTAPLQKTLQYALQKQRAVYKGKNTVTKQKLAGGEERLRQASLALGEEPEKHADYKFLNHR